MSLTLIMSVTSWLSRGQTGSDGGWDWFLPSIAASAWLLVTTPVRLDLNRKLIEKWEFQKRSVLQAAIFITGLGKCAQPSSFGISSAKHNPPPPSTGPGQGFTLKVRLTLHWATVSLSRISFVHFQ